MPGREEGAQKRERVGAIQDTAAAAARREADRPCILRQLPSQPAQSPTPVRTSQTLPKVRLGCLKINTVSFCTYIRICKGVALCTVALLWFICVQKFCFA